MSSNSFPRSPRNVGLLRKLHFHQEYREVLEQVREWRTSAGATASGWCEPLLLSARSALHLEEPEEARARFLEALMLLEKRRGKIIEELHFQGIYGLVRANFLLGEQEKSREQLNRLLKSAHARIPRRLGRMLLLEATLEVAQNPEKAPAILLDFQQQFPRPPLLWEWQRRCLWARIRMGEGAVEKARELLHPGELREPGHRLTRARLYLLRARIRESLEAWEEAAAHLQRALAIFNRYRLFRRSVTTHARLAQALFLAGHRTEARHNLVTAREYAYRRDLPVEELWRVAEEVEQPAGGSVRIWDFLTHQGPTGVSPAILRVSRQIRQAAEGELPVLILGETGVGKEVTARAIHDLSSRSGEPFIIVHTPAITESLFESTLFGHRRGAFTGATEHRQGLVEMSGNGTLFFDEISETTPAVQAKLLRFLDSREYFVVGDPRIRVSGARILAASNQPYGHLLTSRDFRSDLLHRIAGMMIEIPPLRDRIEDLPVLLENWLRQLNAERGRHKIIHRDTFSFLRGYPFPGNVRELQHLFREAWERANSSIQPHHFSRTRMAVALQTKDESGGFPGLPLRKALEGFERDYIRRALQHTRFDKTRTSELLRVSRQTLYNKLRQLGLQE